MALRSSASLALLGVLTPGVSADCSCKYQGSVLPEALYTNYPSSDPGKYSSTVAYGWYGTMCAAWDQMPGTPWMAQYCTADKNFTGADSWCQAPWCYVDESCESKVASSVFNGSTTAYYSYATCGAPDCYTNMDDENCPFGGVFDDACPCIFQGQELSAELIEGYPSQNPGKYQNHTGIELYGTTCAAWDQQPDTPWYSYCPAGSDWCHDDFNWCQAPWCYVSANCSSKVGSSVFNGSSTAFYSYATCGAPDCYSNASSAGCPYTGTGTSNMWNTPVDDCSATTTTTMESGGSTTTMDATTTMESGGNTTTSEETNQGNTTVEETENEGSKATSALALSSITVPVIMAIVA